MNYKKLLTALSAVVLIIPSFAQNSFNEIPEWLSVEDYAYGTGCDFGDINGDGYLDLIVSNGNDMLMAPNFVYMNEAGVIPMEVTFMSQDSLFSGHCEFGDINNDGYPEILVANYISPDWRPGSVQIYSNVEGIPEPTPSWMADDSVYTFRSAFGDPDGDGDLDLAVATGEAYHDEYHRNLIFFNNGGELETTPGWQSDDYDAAYDVQFVDIDNDGDQDLAILTSGEPVKIYFNYNGVIETSPGWSSADNDNGNSFDFADLNGDGYLDMGVANNTQLDGSGLFKIYYSDHGRLPANASWQSSTTGYGSEAVFCDIDGDGDQDFITGRWFGLVYIYLNNDGVFYTSPDWQCDDAYQLVVENIVFADIDFAEEDLTMETFESGGERKLYYLSDRYIQNIEYIRSDGQQLPLSAYCYSLQDCWISLQEAPNTTVTVYYRTSDRKDMAVSNWDGSTYIFYNTGQTGIFDGFVATPKAIQLEQAYPNPFNAMTNISFLLENQEHVSLRVYDLNGRFIETLTDTDYPAGNHSVIFDASLLTSGMYFYKIQTGDFTDTKKMLLIK